MSLHQRKLRMSRLKRSVSSGVGSLQARSQSLALALYITSTPQMKLPSQSRFSTASHRCQSVRLCLTMLTQARHGATWWVCTLTKPEISTLRSNFTTLRRSRPCPSRVMLHASLRCQSQKETILSKMVFSASVRKRLLSKPRGSTSLRSETQHLVPRNSRSTLSFKWLQMHQVISQF